MPGHRASRQELLLLNPKPGYLAVAAAHSAADLPCPTCGVRVRAPRLESHLTRVHGGVPAFEPQAPITGQDRRITRVIALLFGLGVLMAAVLLGVGHTPSDRDVAIAVGVALALLSLIVAAESGAFRATLEVTSTGIHHRWALGVARRVIARPPVLESGSWMSRVPSALVRDDDLNMSEDVKTGAYVSVGTLHVGGRRVGSSLSRWSPEGLQRGRRRRRVDVALDRQGLLAFEWALAAEGWLTPVRLSGP